MSDQFIQSGSGLLNPGNTTTVTLVGVAAGSCLVAVILDGSASTPTTLAVSSNLSGAFTARGAKTGDNTNAVGGQVYTLDNVSAGTHIITGTISGNAIFLVVAEVSGTFGGVNQTTWIAPGTGANAITSGSVTAAGASTFLGFSCDSASVSTSDEPIAGTGYTSRANNANSAVGAWRLESGAGSAAQAVTFTAVTGADHFPVFGVSILNGTPAGPAATEEQRLRRQNRPGRTPYSFGKYFRPVGALSQPAASLRTLTLTANLGSFAMTAVAAGLLHGRLNSAGFASFALTLPTTNLDRNHTIVPAFGSFALSAQAANLIRNRTLVAAMASFGLTGEAANLFKTKLLSVAAGSFAMTGEPIGFVRSHVIAASVGVFAMTGEAAGLLRNRISAMLRASFVLTGEPATLTKFSASSFAFASFVLAGQVASFHGNKRLAGNFAAFVFNAENVNLHVQSSFTRSISRTLAIAGEVRVYSPGAEIRTYTVTNEVRNINSQA